MSDQYRESERKFAFDMKLMIKKHKESLLFFLFLNMEVFYTEAKSIIFESIMFERDQ